MLRLVLDTNVIVAGMRSPSGASAALIKAGRFHRVTLLASITMVMEYEEICMRPEHVKASGLGHKDIELFLDTLVAILEPVEPHFLWRPHLPDSDDEMILEAAINGRADAIVTFNTSDFSTVPTQFGLPIWKPSHTIQRIDT